MQLLLIEESDKKPTFACVELSKGRSKPRDDLIPSTRTRALKMLRSNVFDGVVINLELLEDFCLELISFIRASAPLAPIVMTGRGRPEYTRQALGAGADEVVDGGSTALQEHLLNVEIAVYRAKTARAHRHAEQVLNAMPSPVFVVDPKSCIVFANAAATALLNTSLDAVRGGAPPFEIPKAPRFTVSVGDGTGRIYHARQSPTAWSDVPARMIVLEAVPATLNSVRANDMPWPSATDTFLEIAHEINNPLLSLLGTLELAQGDLRARLADDPALRDILDDLEDANASAGRIKRIIDDINDYARVTHQTSGSSSVRSVSDVVLRLARHQLNGKTSVNVDVDAASRVAMSEGHLARVLLNLVVNAAQAMKAADVEKNQIDIRAYNLPNANQIRIEVSDNGLGVPDIVRHRLFNEYITTKPTGAGTGMGLMITARLVRAIGGAISCRSPGRGTTFQIDLPASVDELIHERVTSNVDRRR